MKVAFVIPVTRTEDACVLVSVLAPHALQNHWDVILVTGTEIQDLDPPAQCIVTKSLHASVRRNLGVNATVAEWIVFLDDDTLPEESWFPELKNALESERFIVTGPTVPMGATFGERISDWITTSPLGEGSLLYGSRDGSSPSFSSIYLCNCLVKRTVWESVGGFNELADWRVDDTEFFYIAQRQGFKTDFRSRFTVRHRRRDFFRGFLKNQFKARYATGKNTVLFPEIFVRIPGVLAMIGCLAAFPFVAAFPALRLLAVILYSLALLIDLLNGVFRYGPGALVMPFAHIAHHLVIGSAFTLGLMITLPTRGRHAMVLKHKAERYGVPK